MKKISIATIAFIFIYVLFSKNLSILFRFSNGFFIIGLTYFCIALFSYARNVGFFKLLSYNNYVRKQKSLLQSGVIDKNTKNDEYRIMKFHEYVAERYTYKWTNGIFLKFAIPLLTASLLLALIAN